MTLRADATQFILPPPGLEGDGPHEGLTIEEIERRLFEGWAQALVEGRVCSLKPLYPVQPVKVPQELVLSEKEAKVLTQRSRRNEEAGYQVMSKVLTKRPPPKVGGSGLFCPWCTDCSHAVSSTCPFHNGPVPVTPWKPSERAHRRSALWSVPGVELGLCNIEEGSDDEGTVSTDVGGSCCVGSDTISVRSDDEVQPMVVPIRRRWGPKRSGYESGRTNAWGPMRSGNKSGRTNAK